MSKEKLPTPILILFVVLVFIPIIGAIQEMGNPGGLSSELSSIGIIIIASIITISTILFLYKVKRLSSGKTTHKR